MGGTQVTIVVPNSLFTVGENPKEPNSAACRGGPERSLSIAFTVSASKTKQISSITIFALEPWDHGERRGMTDLDERL